MSGDGKVRARTGAQEVKVEVQSLMGEEKEKLESRRQVKELNNGIRRENSIVNSITTKAYEIGSAGRHSEML